MMDVLNVNINVLLIVLIVNKVNVMNVKQDMNQLDNIVKQFVEMD